MDDQGRQELASLLDQLGSAVTVAPIYMTGMEINSSGSGHGLVINAGGAPGMTGNVTGLEISVGMSSASSHRIGAQQHVAAELKQAAAKVRANTASGSSIRSILMNAVPFTKAAGMGATTAAAEALAKTLIG